jgi:signal peptidase I
MRVLLAPLLAFCCFLPACGLEKYFSLRHNVAAAKAMSPTIEPGDHFASVGFKDNEIDPIERFNIVVFKPPKNERRRVIDDDRWVFRVVGLSGEKIEIKRGVVYINDEVLDESSFQTHPLEGDFKAMNIPEGEYFLLGDNRPDSLDSRFIGTVKRVDIDGKVQTIIRKADYENGKRW